MCTGHETTHAATLDRRTALTAAGVAALGAVTTAAPAAAAGGDGATRHWGGRRFRDLTYPLTTAFPAFVPGEEAARRTLVTIEEDGYYLQEWRLTEHTGTHVDAPGHFVLGARLAPELRLHELVSPLAVVDIARRAARDADAVVTVDDVRRSERRHGRIPAGAAVVMHSGWGAKVKDPAAYRGIDASGVYHFPGFSPEACDWLVRRRRISSIGVDTLSTDPGTSATFETHVVLASADRYGLENLANVHRVPARGATVVVGLVPCEEGSGGQARVFATW